MLTNDEFNSLGLDEKLLKIYQNSYGVVTEPQAGGVAEVFGRKEPRVQPVQHKIETPEGFTDIFGEEPDKSDSAARANWLNALQSFEGLIPLATDTISEANYNAKAEMSIKADLGVPIAYRFAGQDRITFQNKPKFFRPLSWYHTAYNTLISAARNA